MAFLWAPTYFQDSLSCCGWACIVSTKGGQASRSSLGTIVKENNDAYTVLIIIDMMYWEEDELAR